MKETSYWGTERDNPKYQALMYYEWKHRNNQKNVFTPNSNASFTNAVTLNHHIQSPSHNVKRDGPQVNISPRHHDIYNKFKITNTGALVGMVMQRVTSKKILRKWSPRYLPRRTSQP